MDKRTDEQRIDDAIDSCEGMAETLYHRLLDTVPCPHCRAGVVAALVANLANAAPEFGPFPLEATLGLVTSEATLLYHDIHDGGGDDGHEVPEFPPFVPSPEEQH